MKTQKSKPCKKTLYKNNHTNDHTKYKNNHTKQASKIPQEFLQRYRQLYGEQAIEYIIKFTPKKAKEYVFSVDKEAIISLEKRGFKFQNINNYSYKIIKQPHSISSTIEFLSGKIFRMDLPSIITGYLVKELTNLKLKKLNSCKRQKKANKTSEWINETLILDAFSAPGMKTIVTASLLNKELSNEGNINNAIIALEKNKTRFISLKYNLERSMLDNVIALNIDFLNFKFNGKFDVILLDAPCSGNFYKDHVWFEKRKTDDFNKKANEQKVFIRKALQLMKKQAILVYSVCTLEPEETNEIYDYAEKNLKLAPIKINEFLAKEFKLKNVNYKKAVRLLPWIHETEPFFIAAFRKVTE